jgi:DNA-binding response OmpR family regulator
MANATPASVLLVEDDTLLREAFRMILEDAGYEVYEAGTAADALEIFDRQSPSLVILDLGLPDRPGLDIVRELHSRDDRPVPPVVALTGRVGASERQACLEAGCSLYISKPVRPRELLEQLPDLLR